MISLLPPLTVADLGAGEGTLSQLLAKKARKVIAIDNAPKMVEFGSQLAKKHGFKNLEYRLGDIEDPPIEKNSIDLAIFSQALHHAIHPERAIAAAHRILKKAAASWCSICSATASKRRANSTPITGSASAKCNCINGSKKRASAESK